jgi:hypothetical protein
VVNNVTPAQINATNLVYQVHDGAVNAIPAVYDFGYALPTPGTVGPDADYASYAALIAATISNGHYATCKALGLFRLGSTPAGAVTCDVQGDSGGTGGYVTDTASIVRRIIAVSAPLVDLVDEGSFLALTAAQGAVVGYYIGLDENKSVRQAADDLLAASGRAGASAAMACSRSSALSRRPERRSTATRPTISWTARSSGSSCRLRTTRRRSASASPIRASGRCRPMSRLACRIPASNRSRREFSVASHSNTTLAATIAAAHLLAQDPDPITGYFSTSADAVAEADRLLTLKGGAVRALYSFTLKIQGAHPQDRRRGESLTFAPAASPGSISRQSF